VYYSNMEGKIKITDLCDWMCKETGAKVAMAVNTKFKALSVSPT